MPRWRSAACRLISCHDSSQRTPNLSRLRPAPLVHLAGERCFSRNSIRRFVRHALCFSSAVSPRCPPTPLPTPPPVSWKLAVDWRVWTPCCSQLEGQDTVDKELKKLLLETELSLLDTRVSLHSLSDRDGQCDHSPVTLSLVLGALTVGNISEEGEDTPAPAVPEPEQAPGGGESDQEFQKRVSFEGLRIELSRACVRTTTSFPLTAACEAQLIERNVVRSHVFLCIVRRAPMRDPMMRGPMRGPKATPQSSRTCDHTHRTRQIIWTSSTES
eukprot:COSAG02_NODE_2166_length_9611_cov_5.049201_10_plen_272_part_00